MLESNLYESLPVEPLLSAELPNQSPLIDSLTRESLSSLTVGFERLDLDEIATNIQAQSLATNPDLVISNIRTSTSNIASGATFSFTYGIKNQGSAAVMGSTTRFYLSRNRVWDSSDTLLSKNTVGGINPSETRQETASITINNNVAAGAYYLLAQADGDGKITESNENNNVLSLLLIVTRPDLKITSLNSPANGVAGNSVNFNYTIRNHGNSSTNVGTQTYFYLSPNRTLDSKARLIGQDRVPILGSNTSRLELATLTLPADIVTGNYYLLASVDGTRIVNETSERNNSIAKPITITGVNPSLPDLVITGVASPAKLAAGSNFYVDYTIANRGGGQAERRGSQTKFYLSTDNRLDPKDTYLGEDHFDSLAAGVSRTDSAYLSFHTNLVAGDYYLFAKADADNTVLESNENNNLISKLIIVTKPDLLISNLTIPASAVGGEGFYLDYTLTNEGSTGADWYCSTTKFYLSTDKTLDANDTYLTNEYTLSLGGGESQTSSVYIPLSDNLKPDTYYIIVQADSENEVEESNENNNIVSQAITLTPPLQSDLTITDLVAPDSVNTGSSLNISYTLRNQGRSGTGWPFNFTKFYLSKDDTLDSADVEIGSDSAEEINPGTAQTRNISLEIPVKFRGDTYYLFAKVDPGEYIVESNENNNTASKIIKIVPSVDGYSSSNGFGLVNAASAVARVLNQNSFPAVADLGGNNWGADLINAPEVWARGYTGQGVVVAVLDTGVDRNHADLSGNIWKNIREIEDNGIDDDKNGYVDDVWGWNTVDNNNNTIDRHGHGSHVSGTIAGLRNGFGVTGIAYNAKIMPVKVLSDQGSGSDEGVARGIRYAADNGAKVINLSLGGDEFNQELKDAVQYASSKGAIVVMAAGNKGDFTTIDSYPAAYATNWGIAVGAVDRYNQQAYFSNRAGSNKLAYVTAPGVGVYSTVPNNGYDSYEGTSMATPHVAGVIALMLSAKPSLTDAQVRRILTSTAENSPGPNGGIQSMANVKGKNTSVNVRFDFAADLSESHHINSKVINFNEQKFVERATNAPAPARSITPDRETSELSAYDELTGLYFGESIVVM